MDKRVKDNKENYILYAIKSLEPDEKGIVGVWDVITNILSYISVLTIISVIYKKIIGYKREVFNKIINKDKEKLTNKEKLLMQRMNKLYSFINFWVSLQVVISIIASIYMFYFLNKSDKLQIIIICGYGITRVFEIIIKQIRVILFDTLGKKAIILKSARRSIILLIHNIIEAIFWFAISFMAAILLNNPKEYLTLQTLSEKLNWSDFIRYSIFQFTGFGDGYTYLSELIPTQSILIEITFWETITGFIIIVIAMARFFSLLPSIDVQEK